MLIAGTIRAEPRWRVIVQRVLARLPEPQDMPEEIPYRLVVQPIRFWGLVLPPFNEKFRKPAEFYVPSDLRAWLPGGMMGYVSSIEQLKKEQLPQFIPLAKGKKLFRDIIDIIDPNETDEQATARVENHLEVDRQRQRYLNILRVMQS